MTTNDFFENATINITDDINMNKVINKIKGWIERNVHQRWYSSNKVELSNSANGLSTVILAGVPYIYFEYAQDYRLDFNYEDIHIIFECVDDKTSFSLEKDDKIFYFRESDEMISNGSYFTPLDIMTETEAGNCIDLFKGIFK